MGDKVGTPLAVVLLQTLAEANGDGEVLVDITLDGLLEMLADSHRETAAERLGLSVTLL